MKMRPEILSVFCFLLFSFNLSGQYATDIINQPLAELSPENELTFHQKQEKSLNKSAPEIDLDDLFDEPRFFEEGSSLLSLTIGLGGRFNLGDLSEEINNVEAKFAIPALQLAYERQVFRNFGAGIFFGYQKWRVPVLDYQYNYYAAGLNITYHFNVSDRIDPYIGAAGTLRQMFLGNGERNVSSGLKFTPHFLIGARYYLSDRLGALVEIGDNVFTWVKVGVSYYLP